MRTPAFPQESKRLAEGTLGPTFTIKSLGTATAAFAVAGALARISALLLIPVYTATLSPAEFGVIAILQILSTLLAPIVGLGLGAALGICYFAASTDPARDRVIGNATTIVLMTSIALTGLGIRHAGTLSLWFFGDTNHSYEMVLALLGVAAGALSLPLALRLQFRRSLARFLAANFAGAAVALVMGVVLVAHAGRGISGVLEAQFFGQVAALIGFLAASSGAARPAFDADVMRSLVGQGGALIPSFFFLLVLQQGGQYILKEMHGLASLGAYSVAYTLGMALSVLVSAFTTSWTVHFQAYADRPESARAELGRPAMWYCLGFGAIGALGFVWSTPVLCVFVNGGFPADGVVLGLTALAQVLVGTFALVVPPLYFAGMVWVATLVQGIGAVLSLGLAFALIGAWGAVGAAAGHSLGMLVTSVIAYAWIRLSRRPLVRVDYPWMRILVAASAYTCVAAAFLARPRMGCVGEVGASLVGTAIVGIAALALLAPRDRAIPLEFAIGLLRRRQ